MRGPALLVALGLCALPARGDVPVDAGSETLHYLLTSIDVAAAGKDIINVTGGTCEALTSLVCIVDPESVGLTCPVAPIPAEPALQLRAIRALPEFASAASCGGALAHATLVRAVTALSPIGAATSGVPVLRLRASIEALGVASAHDPADVTLIVPLLDHPSRDIRASAARALRDLCANAPETQQALRGRLQQEQVPQVRLAISGALRDLAACPASRSSIGQP